MSERDSIGEARAVLDRFMAAFNEHEPAKVAATFNFPHVRFHSGKVTIFPTAADFNLKIFAGTRDARDWARSEWAERNVITAGPEKVHFDTKFNRLRADGSLIASYRSIYIVTKVDGRWGIQGRSSFAE